MSTISFNKRNSISTTINTLLCITTLALSGPVYSGAWTGPKGASYHKLGLNYFTSDKSLNSNGDSIPAGSEFTDLNITYYGEYGIRDNLSVFGSVPIKVAS